MHPEQLGLHYSAILPELITAGAAILIMLVDAISPKLERQFSGAIALVTLVGSGVAVGSLWDQQRTSAFYGMIVTDELRLVFALIFLLVTFLTVLISLRWVREEGLPAGEYFALLLFATTGMLLMSAAGDLVMIFLGLEITSISTYVLCGFRRRDSRSNESAVKYFILGSFSTAFLLYGMALVYGATFNAYRVPMATTNLQLIKERIMSGALFSQEMLLGGAAMMIVGFGFKVSTAPFHIWSPDVYEGAPTPVTAFLSTGSKAAAFSAFTRVFILTFAAASVSASVPLGRGTLTGRVLSGVTGVLGDLQSTWTTALAVMAALTMIIGNLAAISQGNIKRMLAYSSIAHAGYAVVGMVAGDWRAVAFYMLSYVVINIGALAVVEVMARRGDSRTLISDYSGIGFQSLGLASVLSLFLLSLAGLPLTAGFMAKLLVFKSAWGAGFHALVVVAVINSAISWYYYLRVIVVMFFNEPAEGYKRPSVARPLLAALVLMAIVTFYLGVLPGKVLSVLEGKGSQIVAASK
ncbi:MAG TPA: NADH-quinone oxidoreductase subunit N [Blastocatellia bacterium]|nr:NADH-quinone oxidoreductase subunit N [Blastocatellia bacterium]